MARLTLLLATLLVFVNSCAEKKAAVTPATNKTTKPADCEDNSSGDDEESALRMTQDEDECNSDDPSDPDPATSSAPGTAYDLCAALKKNSEMSGKHASFLTALCTDGKLDELRGKYYTGGSTAKINVLTSSEKTGGKSEMRIGSAMSVSATPADYFAMTKMQMSSPSKFKELGFKVNPDTEYTVKSGEGTNEIKYNYRYQKTSDPDEVNYEATTKFITLKSGQAYLVSTIMDKAVVTINDLRAIIIINKRDSGTEVVTFSDQTYDNNGNHQSTVDKVKSRMGEEQIRMFENSKDAAKASK